MDPPTPGGPTPGGETRTGSDLDADTVARAKRDALALKEYIKNLKEEKNDASLQSHTSNLARVSADAMRPVRILQGHVGKVTAMQWSHEHTTQLLSAAQDGQLIVWDGMTTHKLLAIPCRSAWLLTCAFSFSGSFVASGGLDNLCTIYSVRSHDRPIRVCRELSGHDGFISACAFLNDREIVTASGDATCRRWDLETATTTAEFVDHFGAVMCLSVAPQRSALITGSCDMSAKLWDIRSGRCEQSFYGHDGAINALTLMSNGESFVTGSDDGTCRLFDIRADRELACYSYIGSGVTSVALSTSGRLLFAGEENYELCVWDTLKVERVRTVSKHLNRVSCVGVSIDGNALCTGSWDTTLQIWA